MNIYDHIQMQSLAARWVPNLIAYGKGFGWADLSSGDRRVRSAAAPDDLLACALQSSRRQ
jgi:hypothetical protein